MPNLSGHVPSPAPLQEVSSSVTMGLGVGLGSVSDQKLKTRTLRWGLTQAPGSTPAWDCPGRDTRCLAHRNSHTPSESQPLRGKQGRTSEGWGVRTRGCARVASPKTTPGLATHIHTRQASYTRIHEHITHTCTHDPVMLHMVILYTRTDTLYTRTYLRGSGA